MGKNIREEKKEKNKMNFSILFCAYNMEDYLKKSLSPFIEAKKNGILNCNFKIVAISTPFEQFNEPRTDNTLLLLKEMYKNGEIDFLIESNLPIKETEARGMALNWAKNNDSDFSFQVDADEFYTLEQIEKIINFVKQNLFNVWFKISLKNLVFSSEKFLKEPFQPPRIHKLKYNTKISNLEAIGFHDDNGVAYKDRNGKIWLDKQLPCKIIPSNIVWVKHFTWLNDERSKKKIEYHTKRWGSNFCSFKWDKEKGLSFNEEYYKMIGKPLPEVIEESS